MSDVNSELDISKLEKAVLDFHPEVGRLCELLAEKGLLSVHPGRLFVALHDWFAEDAYASMRALAARPLSLPVWQVIRRGPAGQNLRFGGDVLLARSPEGALGALLEIFEMNGVYPGDILWADSEIRFYSSSGDLIVSMEHAISATPDLEVRHRIDELLKGVRSRELQRLARRLATFPGLAGIVVAQHHSDHSGKGSIVSCTPDNLAAALRKVLAEAFAVKLEHHRSLELFANMIGAGSWQRIVANRETAWLALPPAALFTYGPPGEAVELQPSPADAIAAFAKFCSAQPRAPHIELGLFSSHFESRPLLRAYSDNSRSASLLAACGIELPLVEPVHAKSLVLARGVMSVDPRLGNGAIKEHFQSLAVSGKGAHPEERGSATT